MTSSYVHPSRAHLVKSANEKSKQPLRSALTKRHMPPPPPRPAVRQKNKPEEDNLLMFGYASKLFPPDKHSARLAKNLHLILWNDDRAADILIDRYDCRASLHDLSEFDGDSWNKNHQFSEEEGRLESYLDDERYRALRVEELEENIRQEEELKRLHASINDDPGSKYSQVQFSYKETNKPASKDQYNPLEPTNDEECDEKPFTAPSSLDVPEEMEIPATEKMNAIIEKTAKFVSQQGAQMEIVLKAKQSNNSQFQFLQFGHYLNPYYKHMVTKIKEGKYNPEAEENQNKSEDEESDSDSDEGGGYLHPSLFASSHKVRQAENIEKTKAIRTVDPDHPLAQLIAKGRAANAAKQYQKMAETMKDYYKNNSTNGSNNDDTNTTLPPFMSMSSHSTAVTNPTPNSIGGTDPNTTHAPGYIGTGVHIVPPPPDMQPIVENIARRVAIEGGGIEATIFTQNPVTFCFLNPSNELYPYYHYRKLAWVKHLYPPPTVESNASEVVENGEKNEQAEDELSAPGPISFSIKPRNEVAKQPLVTSQTTLLLGGNESEEEEIEREDKICVVEPVEAKPTKRKFTEEYEPPPVKTSKVVAEIHSIAKPTPPPTPQVDTPIQPPILTHAPQASTFTAVTPSGEAASISTLRQKQAARRHKALLFLNAKKLQQSKENTSKETPEVEISNLASAASEDIFDLSETSSPASRVDSPTTSTSEIIDGEPPARKRTSRFDILPKNITSSGTVPAVVPVVSTLSVETKGSPRDSGRVPRTDDEIPSAYREENESARGRREPDKRRLSSRLNSQRHKHRHHRNRHKSDDDHTPSKHRSRRKHSRKHGSRDERKSKKRKKEKRRRRSTSSSSSRQSSDNESHSSPKPSSNRLRHPSRDQPFDDDAPVDVSKGQINEGEVSDGSASSEKHRSEGELTSG